MRISDWSSDVCSSDLIDSLALLMNCVYDDIGATIKPLGAVIQVGARGRKWRCMTISAARLRRRNFLYSLPTERLSAAAAVVAKELQETARALLGTAVWPGIEKFPRQSTRQKKRNAALEVS